jgi:hypothetical protein
MRVENETIKKFTNVLLSMLLLLSDFIMGYITHIEKIGKETDVTKTENTEDY